MIEQLDLVTPTGCMTIDAQIAEGAIWVSAQTLTDATSWTLKPEGFCQGDICIPARGAVKDGTNVDLGAFADLVRLPMISDSDEKVLSLGTPVNTGSADLDTLTAPDFSLPDLDGKMHALSDYKGKKILLAAYASW